MRDQRHGIDGLAIRLGNDEQRSMGQGDALNPTPRGERPCLPGARLAGCLLADQVQPVRLHSRGAKQGAAGMSCPADPMESKRRAQAGIEETAGGIRDQSRMAETRHEARGNARDPDGGTPGCPTAVSGRRRQRCGRLANARPVRDE